MHLAGREYAALEVRCVLVHGERMIVVDEQSAEREQRCGDDCDDIGLITGPVDDPSRRKVPRSEECAHEYEQRTHRTRVIVVGEQHEEDGRQATQVASLAQLMGPQQYGGGHDRADQEQGARTSGWGYGKPARHYFRLLSPPLLAKVDRTALWSIRPGAGDPSEVGID